MARKRIYEDHVLTDAEKHQRYNDKAVKIDKQLDEAYSSIDWGRRNAAEINLVEFTKTYLIGLALDEPPSQMGEQVLMQMDRALRQHSNYAIALHRGAGKSAFCICAAVYALVTGLQKFVVIIAHNARSANGLLNDLWKVFQEPDSLLAHDYPNVFLPWGVAQGSYRRRYTYKGALIDMKKTASDIVLPTYKDKRFSAPSGSLVVTRSITGGLRGIRHGTMRPTCCILDDLQSTETAKNPESVQKVLDTIKGDIIPLAGKSRLSILQTFTPIYPDDLVAKTIDDPNWTTTIYPAIVKMPVHMEMWEEYFTKFNAESVAGTGHSGSLQFYKDNREKMDEGHQVFNPSRYSEKDGHLSMIQKLLEIRNEIGEFAFQAEYMMNPTALQYELKISPRIVASRVSSFKEGEVPDTGVEYICASTDINASKYLTTVIMAFMRNHTSLVVFHRFKKCCIPANIPEGDYFQRLYNLLAEHGRELKKFADEHHFRIYGWSIDGNGQAFKAVTEFTKNSLRACGLPSCAFIGQASHMFRSFRSSRLKEEVNRTLLCGDKDEQKKPGAGHKWMYHDSDFFHEQCQKGFLQEVGNVGSISFYAGGNHADWAVQICGERLMMKKARQDGTVEYHWRENGADHDALDAIGQCLATYASQGFATSETGRKSMLERRRRMAVPQKRKVRFV